MTIRFVLDESSWFKACDTSAELLSDAIHRLLDRIDTARERNERVVKHSDYRDSDLGNGEKLYSALFPGDCAVNFERDTAERLRIALDRIEDLNDSCLKDYDVVLRDGTRCAPGVAFAHACCMQQMQVAVLPLPLDGVYRERVPVSVTDTVVEVAFVTDEAEHTAFFRSVIKLENADTQKFQSLAVSAFPALEWADDVWNGLKRFSRPYADVRDELSRCLGGLNDFGALCFSEFQVGSLQGLPVALSAKVGAQISDENGRTKRHKPSAADRTRRHRGKNKVFWWHIKLQPHVDRIHFLYEPPAADGSELERGLIVVGLFTDHCVLPK